MRANRPRVSCLPPPPANDACSGAAFLPNGLPIFVDNRFATTSLDEPAISALPGQAQGAASVWFMFIAEDMSARVSTASLGALNSVLAVYEGNCEQLTELGSNDDDVVGLGASVTLTDLTPGRTCLVKLASRDDAARGLHQLSLSMPAPSITLGDMNY
jgi:hypothetical protein